MKAFTTVFALSSVLFVSAVPTENIVDRASISQTFSGRIQVQIPGNDSVLFLGATLEDEAFFITQDANSNRGPALEVTFFADSVGTTSGVSIQTTNSPAQDEFPFLAWAVTVIENTGDQDNLSADSANFVFLTAATEVPPGPAVNQTNLFVVTLDAPAPYETGVWQFNAATGELVVEWTNDDSSVIQTQVIESQNVDETVNVHALFATGNIDLLEETNPGQFIAGQGPYKFFLVPA